MDVDALFDWIMIAGAVVFVPMFGKIAHIDHLWVGSVLMSAWLLAGIVLVRRRWRSYRRERASASACKGSQTDNFTTSKGNF